MEYIECRKCNSKVKVADFGPHTGLYLTCNCDTHVGKKKITPAQVDETFWVKESEELDDDLKEIVKDD